MVMSAKVTSPRVSPSVNSAANTSAPAQVNSPSMPVSPGPAQTDSYEAVQNRSVSERSPSPTPDSVSDPAFRSEVDANRVQANLRPAGEAQGGESGTISAPGDLSSENVRPAQDEFRGEMRAALNETVRNPPRESQLRRYFRSFRGRPQEAVQAYERYADAYGRHDGEHNYRSRDTVYVRESDGRRLSGRREMNRELRRGNDVTFYNGNNAPDNFNEATRDRGRDRRSNMDCEGFTKTARTLLGEAGLESSAVSGRVSENDGHSAAIIRDPESNRSWVLSNGDAYPVQGNLRSTLDSAFGDTTMNGLPSSYYQAPTQDEAAVRQTRNESTGRID
jgi:hypothetical protein